MDTVLEKLRDDNEYYHGIGKNYLSNSDIGTLLSNPKAYGKPKGDNKALAEGRYFHQLMIEREKAKNVHHVDVSNRNTKEYKSYCEANNIEFALLTKEKENVEAITTAMRSNIQFYEDIYADGNKYEVPGIIDIFGVPFKGKTDIERSADLIDLKSTSDILKFNYSARDYNYDSQAFIYETIFGKRMKFYVVDKETQVLGIFTVSNDFVARGRDKVERAVKVFKKYYGSNPEDSVRNYCITYELS